MNLSLLGLNTYETQAYGGLIEIGEATAAQLSEHSGVPYGRIYDVLGALEHKGFVSVLPTATKKYLPTPPDKLTELLKQKQQEFDTLQEQLQTLTKRYESQHNQLVEVARGIKNFYRIVKETPKSKTFSYSIRYDSKYRADWVRKRKASMKRGVQQKSLARYDDETKENVQKWMEINPHYREFDNDGVALSVNDDSVMIALINQNTTLLIQDKAFVDVMKRLFEATYRQADKLP